MVSDGTIAFASGLTAGFTSTVLLHPLDLIKTRFQVDEAKKGFGILQRLSQKGASKKTDGGASSSSNAALTTKKLHSQLGLRGFYRGLVPAVIGSSTSWALYWLLYENVKRQVRAFECLKQQESKEGEEEKEV